jgi:hypothetical protein
VRVNLVCVTSRFENVAAGVTDKPEGEGEDGMLLFSFGFEQVDRV